MGVTRTVYGSSVRHNTGPVQASRIPSNKRTYTLGGGSRPSGGGVRMKSASMSMDRDPNLDIFGNPINPVFSNTNSNSTNNATTNSDTDGLMRTAKELAQLQIGADSDKMKAAFGYRTQEADQQYGFNRGLASQQQDYRTFNDTRAHQMRLAEEEQRHSFGTKQNFQLSDLRMREAGQQQGFRVSNANQDSSLRMREAGQQYGFSRQLQKDNIDSREKMQQAGFKQDKDMTQFRNNLDEENTRRRALRAAQTFKRQF